MTNKLQKIIIALFALGTASFAVAESQAGLIGERYAAFDLGYVEFDDGGDLTGGTLTLNVPSTIKGLDLGVSVGFASGGYGALDADQWGADAYGVYYSRQQGFTPYLVGSVGYTSMKAELYGYSATESSFTYSVGAGVEIPLTQQCSLDLNLSYNDATNFDDGSSVDAELAVVYRVSEQMWLRCGYSRDFDNDSNTVWGGVALRY